TAEVVTHIDRCLSCLSCMTTCPSGVHYMHLVDHARAVIEKTYRRPRFERLLRAALASLIPDNDRLSRPLWLGRRPKALLALLAALGFARVADRVQSARRPGRSIAERPQVFPAAGPRKGRVALLTGCVTPVVGPSILDAAVSVLTRHGVEVVVPEGQGCCGGVVHHMGREQESLAAARRNVAVFSKAAEPFDAILITASGCGPTLKDYGLMLRHDADCAQEAGRGSAVAMDICEYLSRSGLIPTTAANGRVVAYHAACSLQHGQRITREPKELLARAGYAVKDVPEGHLCCGSAGTY